MRPINSTFYLGEGIGFKEHSKAMKQGDFSHKLKALQQQVAGLRQRTTNGPEQLEQLLPETLEELHNTLAELQRLDEERRAQNQKLISSRQIAEMEHQRYLDLFNFAPGAYLVTDADGTIQEANRAVADLLAVDTDKLVDKSLEGFVAEADHHTFHTVLNRITQLQQAEEWNLRLQPRAGVPFYTAIKVATVPNPHGGLGICWLIHDISGWVETADALKASEEKYRRLFSESRDAIYINAIAGKILDANQAALDLFGYTKEELIGMNIRKLYVQPEDRETFQTEIERKGSVRDYEIKLRKKDRTEMDCLVTSTARRAADGSILGYQGIIRDITERIAAEKALHKAEARFRQLAENIHEVFWLSSLDGSEIYFINPAYESIWGRSREHLIAVPELWLDTIYPADRDSVFANFEKQKRGEVVEHEYRIVRPDGSIRWIQAQVFPVRDEAGEIYRLAGSAQDITQRKQAEQLAALQQQQLVQADKMASLGILVSGMAHEINNPNNFIVLNGEILATAWENVIPILEKYYQENGDFLLAGIPYTQARTKIGQLTSGILEGATRIAKIVETLRDFAHQDTGDLDQQVDVNSVIESAIVIMNNLIQKSTDRFSVALMENLPQIRGNPQQLEQVIINLITNSCQAIRAPQECLVVSTSYNKGSDQIIITILDEGKGVPPENLNRIIEPFFTTKGDEGGTGLGLSVSYSIVKNHGGNLHFTSKGRKGTIATVTLPSSDQLTSETEVSP
jgi:PAS domain S-box-containing protein